MKRKCKHCKTEIEVINKSATIVICDSCRVKSGFAPNEKRDYDTDDFIYCRKCNTVKRRIDLHIKAKHGMTVDQYLEEFPNVPIYAKNTQKKSKHSEETKEKMSKKATETWKDEEIRKARNKSSRFKGKHHTIESKLKIGKAGDYKHSVKGYRKDIGLPVRSIIEANFCRILQYQNIKFKYEDPFVLKDGRMMLIDFHLFDDFEMFKKDEYVELKGWKDETGFYSNKEKFDYLEKHHNDMYRKVRFIFQKLPEWKYFEDKYKDKIPMWEIAGKFDLRTHPEVFGDNKVNEKEEWDEFIICPLCYRENKGIIHSRCKFLSYKHIKSHGYTAEQFRNEFPEQKMKVDSIGKVHSKKMSGENHHNFSKHHSEETREKISSSLKKSLH